MATVADQITETVVLAYNDGPLWAASSQFKAQVRVMDVREICHELDQLAEQDGLSALWISKGIKPLPRVAAHVRLKHPHTIILQDIDDHDEKLARSFREQSLRNRLLLHPGRRMHPTQIRRAQRHISEQAHAQTFSSTYLRELFSPQRNVWAKIPHAREKLDTSAWLAEQPKIRVGLLGTIRAHKGLDQALAVLRHAEETELVIFHDSLLSFPGDLTGRIVQLPKGVSLTYAYSQIDVALVLLDTKSPGAVEQLPAKFVDALSAGTPVVASDTPPMVELGTESTIFVSSSEDTHGIVKAIRRASKLRREVSSLFEAELTPASLSARLSTLIKLCGDINAKA